MKKRNNAYCVFFVYAYLETLVAIFCAFILEKRLFSGVSRQTKCPLINICESLRCEPNCRKNRCKTVYKFTIVILFVLRRAIVDMFLNVGYDCEWMWSQCFYRCVSLSIFPLCIFVGVRDCLIAKGFLFAENLKIRCNQK